MVSSLPHNSPWHRKQSPQPPSAQGSHLQSIESLVAAAIAHGTLTRRDHLTLTATMLSSPSLTATHRRQINQLFDAIRTGQVQVTD